MFKDQEKAEKYLHRKWTRIRWEADSSSQKAYEYSIEHGANHIKAANVRLLLEIMQHTVFIVLIVLCFVFIEVAGGLLLASAAVLFLGMFPIRVLISKILLKEAKNKAKQEYQKMIKYARSELAILIIVILIVSAIAGLVVYYKLGW